MRAKSVFLVLLFCSISNISFADMYTPSHSCSKPYKPYQFNDEWELERFNREVEQYKQCISDFVEEQNRAIRNHSNAADEAIEEWNSYVNYELN